MKKAKIEQYPYQGKIFHIEEGTGMNEDIQSLVYEGKMDLFKRSDLLNNELDTTKYIIYVPYIDYIKKKPFSAKNTEEQDEIIAFNDNGKDNALGLEEKQIYTPKKGDKVEIRFYDDVYYFDVDNSVFSQLNGIEIYVTRTTWGDGI